MAKPVLHLMSGKTASGKSTLAMSLAVEHSVILLSEVLWLARLYPEQIKSVADYVRLARQICEVVGSLVRWRNISAVQKLVHLGLCTGETHRYVSIKLRNGLFVSPSWLSSSGSFIR